MSSGSPVPEPEPTPAGPDASRSDVAAVPVGNEGPGSVGFDVVVIGAGVAGLVAARECAHVGLSTLVLEAGAEPGGCVRGHDVGGIRVDAGAESFATRGGKVAELLGELGLSDAIVAPNPAGSWLHLPALVGDGAMSVPSPRTSLLGIPASPLADDVRAAIGTRAAVRAYLDRIKPILTIGTADRLGPLVVNRMGRAVLDRLVSPISSGVYSTDADDLEVELVAPGLNAAMTRAGSLSGGVAEMRSSAKAGSAVLGIDGGMSRLVSALVADLEHFGVQLRPASNVVRVSRADAVADAVDAEPGRSNAWRVQINGEPDAVLAGHVILATPASAAVPLLAGAREDWAHLAGLPWRAPSPIELVTLVVDAPELDAAPRGTGALVASGTPGVTAKALTHVSAKWAWVAAALPAGRHVLRLSYGRVGEPSPTSGLSDAEATDLALADASAILGVTLARETLVDSARTVWADAVSHAAAGQRERVEKVREALADEPTIEAVGSWLAGTGLASVIPDAREAGQRLRRDTLHTGTGI